MLFAAGALWHSSNIVPASCHSGMPAAEIDHQQALVDDFKRWLHEHGAQTDSIDIKRNDEVQRKAIDSTTEAALRSCIHAYSAVFYMMLIIRHMHG
jgi:hypothetical protein